MPNTKGSNEEEISLYEAIQRAIANVHAALAEIDTAWVRITAERPDPSVGALAALDSADEILQVAREDLARARTALTEYMQKRAANNDAGVYPPTAQYHLVVQA
jgi:hypothetical protein